MKKAIPVIIAIVLMIILAAGYFGKQVVDRYSYSKEQVVMDDFYGVSGDQCAIIYQNEQLDVYAKVKNEVCYMNIDDVHTYLNTIFYYDKAAQLLLYTDAVGTTAAGKDSTMYQAADGSTVQVPYTIWFEDNENCYIAMEYVQLFTNYLFERYGNHLEMDNTFASFQQATIEKDTQIRLKGGVKSPILRQVAKGEKVEVLEAMENWCKVKTSDAIIGYVELKRMSEATLVTREAEKHYTAPAYQWISLDTKVCLGWHAIGGVGGNSTLEEMAAEGTAMNVIAPTWFSLSDEMGNFRNFGEISYVERAHNKGLQVWGVWDDFNYSADNGVKVSVATVLADHTARANLVSGIVDTSVELGLDGVNIDFEKIAGESYETFGQFLRELSVECHKNGLILSVDNMVPYNFRKHYRLDVQADVVDYSIIMGYDEHWDGSDDPGSVASLGFVKFGIEKTLEEVPAGKVVNGLPFYSILWATEGAKVSDEYLTIKNTADFLARVGKTPTWDETTGQNYLEWTSGSKLYQIWLEDKDSLQTKLNAMSSHDIGGVAVWRLGYGTKEIWDLLSLYMQM